MGHRSGSGTVYVWRPVQYSRGVESVVYSGVGVVTKGIGMGYWYRCWKDSCYDVCLPKNPWKILNKYDTIVYRPLVNADVKPGLDCAEERNGTRTRTCDEQTSVK